MPPMAPMAPTRKTDDFDMAKLQKSLKQRQRHSLQARPHVQRLSPAEVRSLNHNATSSKRTLDPPTRLSSATPPPDSPTAYQAQISRASTISLPTTPPRSPSQSSASHHQSHQHVHIHQPRPRASKQADFMVANGLQSRRSSGSTSSSVRSLPMYRGHEVTRTGSLTMLQRPAQDIVANPLSMFSRPRQATVNSAPDPRRDFLDMDPYQAQVMLDAEENDASSLEQQETQSPLERTESPVSVDAVKPGEAERMPLVEASQSANASQDSEAKETVLNGAPEVIIATQTPSQQADPLASAERAESLPSQADGTSKKAPKKRFSFHAGFLEKKDKQSSVLSKKTRRRTVSFTKSTEDTQGTSAEAGEATAKELSSESSGDDIPAHPAIRPLSPTSTRDRSASNPASVVSSGSSLHSNQHNPPADKGKAALTPLIVPKGPVYGRCACCGKIKRPAGFAAELSPVLENENIRTNFSFEMERSRTSHSAGSNETVKPRRYTPIIPMEVADEGREGSIRTVQASIEPPLEDSEIKPRRKRNSEPPKFVRFASLHKPTPEAVEIEADTEEIEVTSTPVVDPTIKPKTDIDPRPPPVTRESRDSIDTMSTASIVTARPVSMTTVRSPGGIEGPKRPVSLNVQKSPSEGSGKPLSTGRRSSAIDQWYDNAIRVGPKQDVITVVGWDDRGKKIDPIPEANGNAVEPAKASSVKETSPYEAQVAHNFSPTKEKENKRKSLLFFKKLVPSSKSDEVKTPSEQTPTSAVDLSSKPSVLNPTDSAIFMSGANGSVTAPSASTHHQTTTTPPLEPNMAAGTDTYTKFKQYSPAEEKKGHAYKLSLGLGGDDMSLGLPTPHLGPHFARSNATLRDLVLAQRTPDTEKELEAAMGSEQQMMTEVKV